MSNNTTKVNNPMKVITGKDTRWSYANVWEAKSINGGAPKFSVSLIIPKSDTVTVQKIKSAIEAAYAMKTLRCCSVTMHIHDELVIEADPRVSLDTICEQMGRTPPWANGLLLRADGYITEFYKKD